jgi:hypothetical protein
VADDARHAVDRAVAELRSAVAARDGAARRLGAALEKAA